MGIGWDLAEQKSSGEQPHWIDYQSFKIDSTGEGN